MDEYWNGSLLSTYIRLIYYLYYCSLILNLSIKSLLYKIENDEGM